MSFINSDCNLSLTVIDVFLFHSLWVPLYVEKGEKNGKVTIIFD